MKLRRTHTLLAGIALCATGTVLAPAHAHALAGGRG